MKTMLTTGSYINIFEDASDENREVYVLFPEYMGGDIPIESYDLIDDTFKEFINSNAEKIKSEITRVLDENDIDFIAIIIKGVK